MYGLYSFNLPKNIISLLLKLRWSSSSSSSDRWNKWRGTSCSFFIKSWCKRCWMGKRPPRSMVALLPIIEHLSIIPLIWRILLFFFLFFAKILRNHHRSCFPKLILHQREFPKQNRTRLSGRRCCRRLLMRNRSLVAPLTRFIIDFQDWWETQ